MDQIIEPVPGVVFDRAARRMTVCGVPMMVGNLTYSPYQTGGTVITEDDYDPGVLRILQEIGMSRVGRVRRPWPEVVHCSLLCGENGWWIEANIWFGGGLGPDGGTYEPGITACVGGSSLPDVELTARGLLILWTFACNRTTAPPEDEFDAGKFGGLAPGTWVWEMDTEARIA